MSNTIHVKGANSQDATASISTGWHLLSAVVDDENVGADLYCDGASVATDGGGFSTDPYPAGACALQIGGRNGSEVASAQDIAEIVVVRGALGDEDRQKVEGYLAHRWGLQDALPDGHPYKAEAPTTVIEPWNPGGGGQVEVDTSGIESRLSGLVQEVEAVRSALTRRVKQVTKL